MTWSLVVSWFIRCGQIGGSIKLDFPYTVVICIHKSKAVLKVMFSLLKKSSWKSWIYEGVEFSRKSLVDVAKSKGIQKTPQPRSWESSPCVVQLFTDFWEPSTHPWEIWTSSFFWNHSALLIWAAACSDVMSSSSIRKCMIVEQVKLVQNVFPVLFLLNCTFGEICIFIFFPKPLNKVNIYTHTHIYM